MKPTIELELDLSKEEQELLQKVQQQHGLNSIEETAAMLFKRKMIDVMYQLTGDVGQPKWLLK